jgi:hypothetical protein
MSFNAPGPAADETGDVTGWLCSIGESREEEDAIGGDLIQSGGNSAFGLGGAEITSGGQALSGALGVSEDEVEDGLEMSSVESGVSTTVFDVFFVGTVV